MILGMYTTWFVLNDEVIAIFLPFGVPGDFFLVVTSISLNNRNFSRKSSQFLDSLYFVFDDKSFITQPINENRVTAVIDTLL